MINRICIVGLGYIGLPTAAALATAGHLVTGVDVNPKIVTAIAEGRAPVVEPGLDDLLDRALASGNLRVSSVPVSADIFIIAVPTPHTLDHAADLTYVAAAVDSILPVVQPGNLVVLESTVPPGTSEKCIEERLMNAGIAVGPSGVMVAHCPERVLPGHLVHELVNNTRIVGADSTEAQEIARKMYQSFVKGDILVTNTKTAEMVKLMENTYRDVNIALANEFSLMCQKFGIDTAEAVALANRHPRVNILRHGPGVGGHCISVDPWFLVAAAPDEARLILTARTVNDGMPYVVAGHVETLLQHISSPKVAVLGVTYKADVDDSRESPAEVVISALLAKGMTVDVHDPVATQTPFDLKELEDAVDGADLVLVLTEHTQFRAVNASRIAGLPRNAVLLDTRNCLDHQSWRMAGFTVHVLGDGRPVTALEPVGVR